MERETKNNSYPKQQRTPTKEHNKENHGSRLKTFSSKKKNIMITPESFEADIRRELSETNDLQNGLLKDMNESIESIRQMRENNEEKGKEIRRNTIIQNEYNEYVTILEIETERYLSLHKSELNQRFEELKKMENVSTSLHLVDIEQMNEKIATIEHSLPQMEKQAKERQELLKELETYQHSIIRTLEKLKKQTSEEIENEEKEQPKQSKYRSYAADIEAILNLANGELLLSYLQTITIGEFCEIQFTQPVLLSLISNVVSNLTTQHIEVRLSYLLLSLKLLTKMAISPRYVDLFRNIQKTFVSFSMLLNHENCYKSILTILFMCEDIIRSLESKKEVISDSSSGQK